MVAAPIGSNRTGVYNGTAFGQMGQGGLGYIEIGEYICLECFFKLPGRDLGEFVLRKLHGRIIDQNIQLFEFLYTTFHSGHAHFFFSQITFNRSEEHTSELQSRENLVCRLLLETKKTEACALRSPGV